MQANILWQNVIILLIDALWSPLSRTPPPPTSLAQDMAAGIAQFPGNVRFLLAERDRTAQAFLSVWTKEDPRIRRCSDATHGFVEPHAREWLTEQLLDVLRP